MSDLPGQLGAVVIGRNEGQRLIKCLTSLGAEFASVVYVDSGSTDGSADAARKMAVTVVPLDMSVPFTAARARNEGFAKLKLLCPDILFVQFIDGDCELVEGWVAAALEFLHRRPDVAVVCGRRRERYPKNSIYNCIIDDEWDTPPGEAVSCGGDAIMRVEAFEAVGGYSNRLIAGEEPELCIRLRERGWKVWRLDREMTWHDIAMTRFSQWWARGTRSGYGCTEVAWLYWNSPFGIWKRETLSALFWAGFLPTMIVLGGLLVNPAFFLGMLIYPIQIVRMTLRRGADIPLNWVKSTFTILDRFAVMQGIFILLWRRLHGKSDELIEYK